jgi:hypothetical protein
MIVIGSTANLLTTALSFLAFAAGVPTAMAIGVFLSPLPLNILLVVSVWRSADRAPPIRSWSARTIALAWLVAATLI